MTNPVPPTPKDRMECDHEWTENDHWNGGVAPYPILQCVRCNATRDVFKEPPDAAPSGLDLRAVAEHAAWFLDASTERGAGSLADMLRAALAAPVPVAVGEGLREAVAEAIYDAMRENDPEGSAKPWVPGGNSLKQGEARRRADSALLAATPEPTAAPVGAGMLPDPLLLSHVGIGSIRRCINPACDARWTADPHKPDCGVGQYLAALAAPVGEPLVERLAVAMEAEWPGWLEEAPDSDEGRAEIREYAGSIAKRLWADSPDTTCGICGHAAHRGDCPDCDIDHAAPVGGQGLDADVATVVRDSSPFRNCQYAAAFRAPCPDVNPDQPEHWCAFCAAHARLRARLRTPEGGG